jgi:large repetitive protein
MTAVDSTRSEAPPVSARLNRHLVAVPGCTRPLEVTRDVLGRLVRLEAGRRVYLDSPEPGRRRVGDGLLLTEETPHPRGFDRSVRTGTGETWLEQHRGDAEHRPELIDGVRITRDAAGRITGCHDEHGNANRRASWSYQWDGDRLTGIDGPFGHRRLSPDHTGRPARRTEGPLIEDLHYGPDGVRLGVPELPTSWHRDAGGRLLSVVGPDGVALAVWLWDGLSCVGRIDGPLGDPLAAAFTLDPTGTPIRLITPAGSLRLPRDAYGEGLIGVPGVPGLQGGTGLGRYVHFRSRVLDPLTGSWCAADPFDGGPSDPRREDGHRGQLLVERAQAGDWSVCAGDPVGRIDPTGEVSVPLVLSDLTWSLPTNLGGWLGMEFSLNFWYSIFAGTLRFEGLSASDRSGSYGVNLSGMFASPGDLTRSSSTGFYANLSRLWTYGHIVWGAPGAIDVLDDARVFLPAAAFRPTLYGSLLRLVPAGGSPFLLAASQLTPPALPGGAPPSLTWTRAGGPSEPVIPGSPIPAFPSGGFHLDTIQPGLGSPAATMTELEIVPGPLASGTVAGSQAALIADGTGLGLKAGDLMSVAAGGGATVVITTAQTVSEDGSHTRVLLTDAPGALPASPVRARAAVADGAAAESLPPIAGQTARLGVGSKPYVVSDVLRLSQVAVVLGSVQVTGLEAQVTLDADLPPTAVPGLTLALGLVTGGAVVAQAAGTTLTYATAAAAPLIGRVLQVAGGTATLLVVVSAAPTATTRTVDRDLGAVGATVTTRLITAAATTLGTATTVPSGGVLTYQPTAIRRAPSTGPLIITDHTSPTPVTYARAVQSLGYDALVVGGALPGNTAAGYNTERFAFPAGGFDRDNLTVEQVTGLNLTPAAALDGAVALQLHQFAGPAVSATTGGSATTGALVADTVTFATRPVVGATPNITTAFTAGQLTVLTSTATPPVVEATVVRSIRLIADLDRPLDLAADGFDVALLQPFGPVHDAQLVDPTTVTVLPSTGLATGGPAVALQMPRFGLGELVLVSWTVTGSPATNDVYRITAVDGCTCKLVDGPTLPTATNYTVQRMVPAGATTTATAAANTVAGARIGVALVGRAGTRRPVVGPGPGAGNASISIDVWQTNQPFDGASIAVVDSRPEGKVSRPARIARFVSLEAHLNATPAMPPSPVTLSPPALGAGVPTALAASFTRDATKVTVPALTLTPGPNLVVAIPFRESPLTTAGQLSSGTVLIPDDPEAIEFGRKQAVVEHELQHTLQAAKWGPLLLSFIPLGLIEGLFRLGPDAPRPGFSAYVPAAVPPDGTLPALVIADPQGVPFATGDSVQVAAAAGVAPTTVVLGASTDGKTFTLPAGTAITPGAQQIRRVVPDPGWKWVDQVMRTLTTGGLLELVTGSLYSGMTVGIGELFYAGYRLFDRSKDYPAIAGPTDAGGVLTLHLDDDAGRQALAGAARITVTGTDGTVTRSVTVAGDTLTLDAAIDLAAPLRVAPYSTRNADSVWDWHSWYAATLPDPTRPGLIKVEASGPDKPSFAVNDKVSVHLDHSTYWAHVTAVHDADGTIELDQAPGKVTDLRIAKLGSEDPLQDKGSWVETQLGMGWMRWAFDPYGQLAVRLPAEHGKWTDYLTRSLRYLLGSKSWGPIPFLGYWFLDNARHQFSNSGHLSAMEQGASHVSGDTYCSLGTLTPDPGDSFTVGDVVRYRVWPSGGGRGSDTVVRPGQFDAPGVMIGNTQMPVPVAVPFVTPETGTTSLEPNRGAGSPAVGTLPAGVLTLDRVRRSVPSTLFSVLPGATPYSASGPLGFKPLAAGWVPNSSALERTQGIYVGFSQAGSHRITVVDNNGVNASGSDAQRSSFPDSGSTLFYDVTVKDVIVTVNGQPVAEGDTVPLVLTQRAAVTVTPGGDRRYQPTLLQPTTGAVLRLDPTGVNLVARATLPAAGTPGEPVEISRVYRRQTDNTYDGGGVALRGLHWPGDLHVPVRAFTVVLTATVPLRATADPAATVLTNILPGNNGFALIPAAVFSPPLIKSTVLLAPTSGPPAIATARLPVPVLTSPTPAAGSPAAVFIGPGVVMQAAFPAADPPEESATVVFAVQVGTAAEHAELTSTVELDPWFRLTAAGYQVARGAALTLDCTDAVAPDPASVAIKAATGTPLGPMPTLTTTVTTVVVTVPAGTPPGFYEVTAAATGAPDHQARRTIAIT